METLYRTGGFGESRMLNGEIIASFTIQRPLILALHDEHEVGLAGGCPVLICN
jgi:hypothetical protein